MIEVKCCVVCETNHGPSLLFVKVRLTQELYDNGDHYDMAGEWADDNGCDGLKVVVDEYDPGRKIMTLCENWGDVPVVSDTD